MGYGTEACCGNLKCVKQNVNGTTIYTLYDQAGQLVHVDALDAGKSTDYIHGAQGTLARISNNAVTYLHHDILGSAQSGTDSTGAILWQEAYTPFGEALNNASANKDLAGFTGHIKDDATGLSYMQARYYDSVIGRFYSNDPVGYTLANPVMSFNRYLYVNNNPYKYTDPNGEFLDTIIDVALIAYDLGDMVINVVNDTNSASLTANIAGALIPGATGLGLAARAGKAAKRSCCFVAGTQVLTEDGYKNIEDVKLGEKLWAKDVETGEQDWKPVVKIFNEPDRGIYEIKLE